uniref:Putative secreted protein n=1 Tax=Xenopsylla cheopis TaxID=163159 RepID=A0A6M2E1M1_XENCH
MNHNIVYMLVLTNTWFIIATTVTKCRSRCRLLIAKSYLPRYLHHQPRSKLRIRPRPLLSVQNPVFQKKSGRPL